VYLNHSRYFTWSTPNFATVMLSFFPQESSHVEVHLSLNNFEIDNFFICLSRLFRSANHALKLTWLYRTT
jgi:hypothetical protein